MMPPSSSNDGLAPTDYDRLLVLAGIISHLPLTTSLDELAELFKRYQQVYLAVMLSSPDAARYESGLTLLSGADITSKTAMLKAIGESLRTLP